MSADAEDRLVCCEQLNAEDAEEDAPHGGRVLMSRSLVISRPRPTTEHLIAAWRVATRASLSHLRSGCPDCDGWLCPLGRQLEERADEASAALPYDALARVSAEAFGDDDDSDGPDALTAIVVAAISGLLLFWLPLLLLLWPSAVPTLGR